MLKNENNEMALEKIVKKIEDSKDKEGYTFGEHLTEIVNRILANPKEYPLDRIEDLSYLVKLSRLRIKQPLTDVEVKGLQKKVSERCEWVNKFKNQAGAVSSL